MAKVLVEAGESEEIVYANLEAGEINNARQGIPIYDQRRWDVYPDVSKGVKLEE
jgi:predicted amidohydrolase